MESPIPRHKFPDYYDMIIEALNQAQALAPKNTGVHFLDYKRKVEILLE
jgi:hypothetical protein